VAQEVVAREALDILTPAGVRAWVRGHREEPAERWEYLDAAIRPIWIAFISESDAADTRPWALRRADGSIRERYFPATEAPVEGFLHRVSDGRRASGEFQQMDGTPLAGADWPFAAGGPAFADATLYPDGTYTAAYLGY
jgi:hypothetical protein